MLGNAIALISIAAMFGLEAFKSDRRISRHILATFAVIFFAIGLFIDPIVSRAPDVGIYLAQVFGVPLAWFILLIALFFVLRPFWQPQSVRTGMSKKMEDLDVPISVSNLQEERRVKLTKVERDRVSQSLIAVDQILKNEMEKFLSPLRELRNYKKILAHEGAGIFHEMVEAPRPSMRQFIDYFSSLVKPHIVELQMLDINIMSIKTAAIPLWDALLHVSNTSQVLGTGPINSSPLDLPMREFGRVLGGLENEIENTQRQIDSGRAMLARGDLDD